MKMTAWVQENFSNAPMIGPTMQVSPGDKLDSTRTQFPRWLATYHGAVGAWQSNETLTRAAAHFSSKARLKRKTESTYFYHESAFSQES